MLSEEFEPTIPEIKRLQTYALDRMANGIGPLSLLIALLYGIE
jgi:hypothetical protein